MACQSAATTLGKTWVGSASLGIHAPKGCYLAYAQDIYWNRDGIGGSNTDYAPICDETASGVTTATPTAAPSSTPTTPTTSPTNQPTQPSKEFIVTKGYKYAHGPNYIERTGTENPFHAMNVGGYASPSHVDIDGDGLQDVMVGNAVGGISFFKNMGTVTQANYMLQAGGAPNAPPLLESSLVSGGEP